MASIIWKLSGLFIWYFQFKQNIAIIWPYSVCLTFIWNNEYWLDYWRLYTCKTLLPFQESWFSHTTNHYFEGKSSPISGIISYLAFRTHFLQKINLFEKDGLVFVKELYINHFEQYQNMKGKWNGHEYCMNSSTIQSVFIISNEAHAEAIFHINLEISN